MPVKIGADSIAKAYVGSDAISRIYIGADLVADFSVEGGEVEDAYGLSALNDVSGLVAYWRMGDTSAALLADSSGNGHDGSYPDAPATFGATELAGAITTSDGRAVNFGGDGYGTVAHNAAFSLARGTLAFYLKVNALANDPTAFTKGNFRVRVFEDGSIRLSIGALNLDSKTDVIQAGVEYHVAAMWDEISVWLMLDGRMLFWDRGHTTGLTTETADWEFGRAPGGVTADVVLDEVALYNQRLSHWSSDLDTLSEWARGLGYDPTPETSEVVGTVAEIQTALQAAANAPGHHILVAAGTYNGVTATITRSGLKRRPLVIKPQGGSVTFTNHNITVQGSWVVIDGISEQSGQILIDRSASRYVRLTRMTVTDIDAHQHQTMGMFGRVDHCDYSDVQNTAGCINTRVLVDSEGADPSGQSTRAGAYTHIDHNYYHDSLDFGQNGNEAIQIGNGDGDSRDRTLDPWCTLYHNRVERYLADTEPVSYKANGCLAVENAQIDMDGGRKSVCRHGGFHWMEREWWDDVSDHTGSQGIRILSENNVLIGCKAVNGTRILLWSGDVTPATWRAGTTGTYPAGLNQVLIGCEAGAGDIVIGEPGVTGADVDGTVLYDCTSITLETEQVNTTDNGADSAPIPFTTATAPVALSAVGPDADDPLVPPGWL